MKAVICPRYGPPEVLKLKYIEKPVPKDNQVLIKIHASSVTQSDVFLRSSKVPLKLLIPMRIAIGILKPRKSVIGLVFSGEIEAVGKNIQRFKSGDQVYGLTGYGLGAYAEYKCMKENDSPLNGCLAKKPASLTHEEATTAAYGGLLAFQFMEKGNIKTGQSVAIYGASGASGTIAVQYAKYLGAHVTWVCSTKNMEFVKSLGAEEAIDYTTDKYLSMEKSFDFVLDAVGQIKTSKTKKKLKKSLTPGGKYASIDDGDLHLDSSRLDYITKLIEEGHIQPIMDRTYPLEQIAEAHAYVEKGHKVGGVALTI